MFVSTYSAIINSALATYSVFIIVISIILINFNVVRFFVAKTRRRHVRQQTDIGLLDAQIHRGVGEIYWQLLRNSSNWKI